jgi:hypothetical protein
MKAQSACNRRITWTLWSRVLCAPLALAILGWPAPAPALEISYLSEPVSKGGAAEEQILMSGDIEPGDAERLVEFIRKDPQRFLRQTHITIASPGGDVVEALRLAELIRYTYLPVRVDEEKGPCVSACFFIYVSAVDRYGSPIGVHRPYLDPEHVRDLPPSQAQETQDRVMRGAREFLQDAFVPTRLIDASLQRASTQVYWLTAKDLTDIGFHAPWYEEYLIAQCGYKKGAIEAYLKAKEGSKDEALLLKHIISTNDCGLSKTAEERRDLVQALISLSEDDESKALEEPYIRKVEGIRELIKAKQIAAEAVAATVVADPKLAGSGWTLDAADVQKLEGSQTWWLDSTDETEWGHFTVYVRNTTERPVASLLFELTDVSCDKTPRQRLLLALPLSKPLRPFEDRALRFSAALPQGHTLLAEDGVSVCGSIVGAR